MPYFSFVYTKYMYHENERNKYYCQNLQQCDRPR